MNTLTELRSSKDLLVNLTLRELRGMYKRSVLGWAWSMINPFANMLIFTLVFGYILKVAPTVGSPSGVDNYPAFLLCGMLAFNFMSNSLNGGMASLLGNAGLIKKVYFPREVLVAAMVLSLDVTFLIEMGVLCTYLVFLGSFVLPWILPALGVVVLLSIFCLGLALMFSVLNVYFRDLQYLVSIGLQLWFYATPIIYPITLVSNQLVNHPALMTAYRANPMVEFVSIFRSLLYDRAFPSLGSVAYVTAWSFGLLIIGYLIFRKFSWRLAEEL
jgi:ABC-type polysaccharide/polyol phosphate export permease